MQTYELSADVVGALASTAPANLWSRVVYSDGILSVPDDIAGQLDLGSAATIETAHKASLVKAAANKRWQVETGGIMVGGALVDTSRDSQAMITGAYAYSQANPTEAINYKAASGWVTLDAATMAVIATAVGAHVQACFAVEAQVSAEIEAGTITTIAEIDAADWPT